MKKQSYYLIGSKGGTSRWIYITFFCIIAFSFVFFPFYAVNLRYQIGYIFRQILDGIGWISLTLGSLLTALSILSLFTGGRSMRTSTLIVGIVLLWIGCWVTGSVFNLFGITIGNERASGGYH